MRDFYGSLLGIPIPGATLPPIAAFLLLAVYGKKHCAGSLRLNPGRRAYRYPSNAPESNPPRQDEA